jgi:hypothetical protein
MAACAGRVMTINPFEVSLARSGFENLVSIFDETHAARITRHSKYGKKS